MLWSDVPNNTNARETVVKFFKEPVHDRLSKSWSIYRLHISYSFPTKAYDMGDHVEILRESFYDFYRDISEQAWEELGIEFGFESNLDLADWPILLLTSPFVIEESDRKPDRAIIKKGVEFSGYMLLSPRIPFCHTLNGLTNALGIIHTRQEKHLGWADVFELDVHQREANKREFNTWMETQTSRLDRLVNFPYVKLKEMRLLIKSKAVGKKWQPLLRWAY